MRTMTRLARTLGGRLGLAAAALAIACGPAAAQQLNPVYTDDSPVASETLARITEFVAASNESEAVRELQKLLDEQPDRLVATPGQSDLLTGVRARVHAVLLGTPKLLDLYREAETARAAQLLNAGDAAAAERSRLLTAPGFEAALRVAQTRLESSQFDAAYLTLAQLESHPDRRDAARGRDAAALMRTVSRYCDRADVREHAQRWAKESGLPDDAGAPVGLPASLSAPRTGYDRPAGPLDPEGVPPRALWTTAIEPQQIPLDSDDAALRAQQSPEETGLQLWILPTIVGDTVYVNDGVFITARDRFTLQPRWSIRPVSEEGALDPWAARRASVAGRLIEDTCSVTVHGQTLVATTGIAQNGDRDGDPGTFAVDCRSGRVMWSIVAARLDPQLDGATVRGPALIDGGVVVLGARKQAQGRRITSFYLFGVALDTGKLLWVRPAGSAGAIPWGRGEQRVHPAPILSRGVVYAVDPLGVIAAVEAANGRPVWVRKQPAPAMGGGPVDLSAPWTWDAPIARGDTLLTLSPDRSEALVLDAPTGALLARRAGSALGEPGYLLPVGERIAAVAKDAVYFASADDLASAPVSKTNTFPMGIRGRVVVAGDKLMVPRTDGIAVIDPARPAGDAAIMRLDRLGNALPLDSQLLVIDSQSLHSYLTWTVAQRLLQERMTASPDDPEPAVTYADLAYRSQHAEQIAEAADKALAAIDRAPTSELNRLARQRLFRVLRDMVESSQERWAGSGAPVPPPHTPTRREQPGRKLAARPQPVESPPLDLPVMAQVLERMGRAAGSPDERVSHLMALGRYQDAAGKPALAAESYQAVLADPLLASASWRMQSAAVRADIEATRRVRQLVLERGPGAYQTFEAAAERELAGLGATPSTQSLEKAARQYPAAAVAAVAWSRAADLHEAAGRMHAAVAALREALAAAEMSRAAGGVLDPGALGGIAGSLVVRLQKLDQYFAAAQLVSRLRGQYPDLVLSDHGTPIDAAAAQRDLLGRLAAIQRFPRIGPDLKQETQALPGWTIMTPKSREQAGRACENIMMISSSESRVALWGVAGGAGEGSAQTGASSVQLMWSREYKGQAPVLLRLDPDSVYLFWDKTEAGDGAVVERIGAVGGETRWRTDPFRTLFPADPELEQRLNINRNIIETPLDGMVRLTDVAVSMDEQVFAIVERSGRAEACDLEAGKLLWSITTAVSQVHDVDVGGGAVVIGGAQAPTGDRAGFTPIVAVVDARTGVLMHNMTELPNTVRWIRVADHGDQGSALIVATAAEIGSYDLVRAKPNWSIAGGGAFGSLDAWMFGDRLFILDEHRSLWLASLATGEISKQVLETYEHLIGSGPIDAAAIGEDRKLTAFTTDRGVCVFDQTGKLVGIDSINGEAEEGAMVPPAIAEAYFVAIQTQPHQGEENQTQYDMSLLDAKSGMLKLTRRVALEMAPRKMAVLDGRILITAGSNTVVYQAPEADTGLRAK